MAETLAVVASAGGARLHGPISVHPLARSAFLVEQHEHGVVIRTHDGQGMPVDDLVALEPIARALRGWTDPADVVLAIGVARALGAMFAICRRRDVVTWEAELNARAERGARDPLDAWLRSTDVGLSALSIAWVLSGHDPRIRDARENVPHDGEDVGRCVRLLDRMGWRDRLSEVAAEFPRWAPIVARWDEIEALHRMADDAAWRAIRDILDGAR